MRSLTAACDMKVNILCSKSIVYCIVSVQDNVNINSCASLVSINLDFMVNR